MGALLRPHCTAQARALVGSSDGPSVLSLLREEAKGWWDKKPITFKTDVAARFVAASGEYLSRATPSLTHDTFTFAAWVKLGSTADFRNIAGVYNTIGNQRGWFLRTDITTGLLSAYLYSDGVTGGMASSSASVPVGSWAHVCVINDGANIRAYVDGVGGPAMPYTGGVFDSSADFQLGSRGDASFPFEGEIAFASYWSRALSAAEVSAFYNGNTPRPYSDLSSSERVDMASFWHLNEPSGQRYDAHGSNHLTDNNTVGVANGPVEYEATEGAAITKWVNQAGNASLFGDVAPTSLNLSPVLSSGVKFSGGQNLRTFIGSMAQPATVIAVFTPTGSLVSEVICDGTSSTGRHLMYAPSSGVFQIFAGATLVGTALPADTRQVVIALFNGGAPNSYLDAAGTKTTGNVGSQNLDGLIIGASFTLGSALDATLEQLILIDRELTTAEITALQTL